VLTGRGVAVAVGDAVGAVAERVGAALGFGVAVVPAGLGVAAAAFEPGVGVAGVVVGLLLGFAVADATGVAVGALSPRTVADCAPIDTGRLDPPPPHPAKRNRKIAPSHRLRLTIIAMLRAEASAKKQSARRGAVLSREYERQRGASAGRAILLRCGYVAFIFSLGNLDRGSALLAPRVRRRPSVRLNRRPDGSVGEFERIQSKSVADARKALDS